LPFTPFTNTRDLYGLSLHEPLDHCAVARNWSRAVFSPASGLLAEQKTPCSSPPFYSGLSGAAPGFGSGLFVVMERLATGAGRQIEKE
jgi:hypothetical protein